jgi:hypothetical protein
MSKSYNQDDINIQKYYIVTQPTRLSDLDLDGLDDPSSAVKRGRKLRERRMARIRNQLD